ncbi:MAG: hypothetical protein HPY44_10565 [Armatimonadetes bacterium]|nr:hypothetical protein [Armatimonadota bacterium]
MGHTYYPVLCVFLFTLAAGSFAAPLPPLEDMGTREKLRIVVDKVMQPVEGWVTKEWMITESAEAGFNVFSPRRGHENLDEVRQVAQWCEKAGIYFMPWMRGSLSAPEGPEADGKRLVWENGGEQPLYSPNSDAFWEWTTRYIVEYAKMSVELPAIMGVFLDYENYAPGLRMGNLYSLSFDTDILARFGKDKGLEIPELEPAKRAQWLRDKGLFEQFEEYQVNHWRERCRTLREAVDQHNPRFRFCIYPAPGTPFMLKACYPEWATEKAPVIAADPWVYGRPSRYMPQKEALEANLARLESGIKTVEALGVPFIYSGGIDPVVTGADPEFCGKNAVMISQVTGGYWIFYEGPTYDTTHKDYFKWFSWANREIAAGRLDSWKIPREEPEEWFLNVFAKNTGGDLVLPEFTGETVKFTEFQLRSDNLLFVVGRKGEPVRIAVRHRQVGKYEAPIVWNLRAPDLTKQAEGTIPAGESGVIEFTPQADGIGLLGISAGSCAVTIESSNAPIGLAASEGVTPILAVPRLYFHVPPKTKEFSLIASGGSGIETVRINVYAPDGSLRASAQTTPQQNTAELKIAAGEDAGKTWALEVAKADEGVLEDSRIRLMPPLPGVLSLAPEHVFRVKEKAAE